MTVKLFPRSTQGLLTPHWKSGISEATSQFLDFSRWAAAFFVVFSHVRSIVLANYSGVTTHSNILVELIYFAAGFGHMSVVVFFVISGFLVGGRVTLKAAKGGFSLLDYAVHRFARIYIVLLPALIVGLEWDKLGATTDNFGLYTNTSHFHWWMIDDPITQRLGLLTWLGNLFMLQTIFVEPLGSNGPLWSLANEWWYYVIFGLAVALFLYPKPASRLACCLGIVALLVWLPFAITVWFVLWLLGVGVAVVEQRWCGWPAPVGIGVLLAVIISERLLPATGTLRNQFFLDFGLAIGFSVALLCAKRGHWALGNLHPWLASFSYTTYLVHVPVMALLVVVVHRAFGFGIGEQPGFASIGFMAALIAALYLYAWIFASLTEFQTEKARIWLRRFVDANFVNATYSDVVSTERAIPAGRTMTATNAPRTADAKLSRLQRASLSLCFERQLCRPANAVMCRRCLNVRSSRQCPCG